MRHRINIFLYLLLPTLHSKTPLLTCLFIQHRLCVNCCAWCLRYPGDGNMEAVSAFMEFTVKFGKTEGSNIEVRVMKSGVKER